MQAIKVQYLGPTNHRGARLKASCERGSITIPYPHELSRDGSRRAALTALVDKFCAEDRVQYGTPPEKNPWNCPWVGGEFDGVTYFVGSDGRHLVLECASIDDAQWVRKLTGNPTPSPLRIGILRDCMGKARV